MGALNSRSFRKRLLVCMCKATAIAGWVPLCVNLRISPPPSSILAIVPLEHPDRVPKPLLVIRSLSLFTQVLVRAGRITFWSGVILCDLTCICRLFFCCSFNVACYGFVITVCWTCAALYCIQIILPYWCQSRSSFSPAPDLTWELVRCCWDNYIWQSPVLYTLLLLCFVVSFQFWWKTDGGTTGWIVWVYRDAVGSPAKRCGGE